MLKSPRTISEQSATCTYCPSLCLHTCPVSTVEAKDSVSPWGKMSLVHHMASGHMNLGGPEAAILYKCTSCGACTSWCRHDIDVAGVLRQARVDAIAQGVTAFSESLFRRPDMSPRSASFKEALGVQRYHEQPTVLLFPGHGVLNDAPDVLSELWVTLSRLEDDDLALGKASALDSGYLLWSSGYENAFRAQASRVAAACEHSPHVVVLSAMDLHMFTNVYPQYGVKVPSTFMDLTSYLLPLLSGAAVERQPGAIGYFDGCHAARHCDLTESSREVLRRITAEEPRELALCGDSTDCCGAGGGFAQTDPVFARESAKRIIVQAEEQGIERLLSFSPECVTLLQSVVASRISVEHGITLVNEAVGRS